MPKVFPDATGRTRNPASEDGKAGAPLRVLVAPSGFKESLSAEEVADGIAEGFRRVLSDVCVCKVPLMDGGEGFTAALVAATGGYLIPVVVTGPTGLPVASHFGFLGMPGPKTAVLEMAAAAGLRLVPADVRDPLVTTTYGVGELIRAALDAGAERLLVGCGDSGTSDAGAGMAQALGVRLLDAEGRDIPRGARGLHVLQKIDSRGLDGRLRGMQIDVACNWDNHLCDPDGVARVFGPQKGASQETVELLAAALDHFAAVVERDLGLDVRNMPGSGASGGLGAGLHVFLGAQLRPRFEIVGRYVDLDALVAEVDLVVTAEGSLDGQTPKGKIPAEVARRAKKRNLPVVALAGSLGKGVEVNYQVGMDAFVSILRVPCTLRDAIRDAGPLLTACAENVARLLAVGMKLERRLTSESQSEIVVPARGRRSDIDA